MAYARARHVSGNGSPYFGRTSTLCPTFTIRTFLCGKSSTVTTPSFTFVYVPSQRSAWYQSVPRTVAELKRPVVRKPPSPEPHRARTIFVDPVFAFACAAWTFRLTFAFFVVFAVPQTLKSP